MRWLPVLLLVGCAYKVDLVSDPAGARVELPDGSAVFTPEQVKLKVAPFTKQEITASAPGYRPLTLDVRRREATMWRYVSDVLFRPGTWLGRSRGTLELQLVPQHGPVGTWSPETEDL